MDYLDDDEPNFLLHSYSVFLQGIEFQNGTAIFDRYAGVELFGERYGSLDSRSERSSYIIAPWVGVNGNIDPTTCNARPGVMSYYLSRMFSLIVNGELLLWLELNSFRNILKDTCIRVALQRYGARTSLNH